jgi:diaminopimelate epimerase
VGSKDGATQDHLRHKKKTRIRIEKSGIVLIAFNKYHALQNDFLVIEQTKARLSKKKLSRLARSICDRRAGAGADGILYLSQSIKAERKLDVFNADGSWAEKSGNGLRIAGVHQFRRDRRRKQFVFETTTGLDMVVVAVSSGNSYVVKTELGQPEFRAEKVPVKTKFKYMINVPLVLGGLKFPITCVAVGNPHAVLFVDDLSFDWKALGAEIETHRAFPNRTNVEFAKVINRRKLKVTVWERGVGATGSSGTGAAAAVCAAVMLGLVDRRCEVVFETGSLQVDWREGDNTSELTGPVESVCQGWYEFG